MLTLFRVDSGDAVVHVVLHILDGFVQEQKCKTPFGPADPFTRLLYTYSGRFPERCCVRILSVKKA